MAIYDDSLDRLRLLEPYALGEMHDRLYPEIYRYVGFRLGTSAAAEEIASTVFSTLLDALRHQRGPKVNLRGWLFQIAEKIVNQEVRRGLWRNQVDAGVDKVFWSAFHSLSLEQQHLLTLRFMQDWSLEEIAFITVKPLNTLRKIQFRALVALAHRRWGLKPGQSPGAIRESDSHIRAVEVSLQNFLAGDNLDEVLAHYPQWAGGLKPLLQSAVAGYALGASLFVPDRAMALARTNFLYEASVYRGQEKTSGTPVVSRSTLIGLGIFLMLALGFLGLAVASHQMLPGDRLYGIKTAVESFRLIFAYDPAKKLALERAFDQERLREVQNLAQQRRLAAVSFSGRISQYAGQDWIIAGLPIRVPGDAQVVGEIAQDIFIRVDGSLQPDGVIYARRIQAREFTITGTLQVQTAERWVIGQSSSKGVEVRITTDTVIQGSPQPGRRVEARLVELSNGSWLARWVEVAQ